MDEITNRGFVVRSASPWDGVSRDTVSRSLMSIECEPTDLTGTPKQGARHNVKNATRSASSILASFAFPRFRPRPLLGTWNFEFGTYLEFRVWSLEFSYAGSSMAP